MKREFYLILGGKSAGKGSTIRALTGLRDGVDGWRVKTSEGIRKFYVLIQSLQEKTAWPPTVLVRKIKRQKSPCVLISLRIDANSATKMPALHYIKEIQKQKGWVIREVVALGVDSLPAALLERLPVPHNIPYVPNRYHASNETAHAIREWWKWD